MQHLVAVLPFQKLSDIDVTARLDNKKPILDVEHIIIEGKNLEYIFDYVFPVFKSYPFKKKEHLLRLEDLNNKRRFSLKQLLLALLTKDKKVVDEVAKKYAIPSLLLEFIAELVSAPYFELCSEYFNKRLSNYHWREPFCPVCGNLPSMAKINEQTNTKMLWCRFCDTTWTFYNKICPFCLNKDIETQRYIFLSNKKPFRIEACSKCNNYLKTVDNLITFGNINFSVANIATYYLDIFAKKYGYNLNNYFKFFFETS